MADTPMADTAVSNASLSGRPGPREARSRAVIGAVAGVLLTGLVASGVAEARNIERRGHIAGDRPSLPCTIQVDFEAGPVGPDMDAFVTIRTFILASPDIDHAEAWGWGVRGAFSFCLTVYDAAPAAQVHDGLTALIPPQAPPGTGPVHVVKGPRWTSRTP